MKRLIFILIASLVLFGCSDSDDDKIENEIPFHYTSYSGNIKYPDNVQLDFKYTFRKDFTFRIYVNTTSIKQEEWRLKIIEGTYTKERINIGVFNIQLSNTATVWYGYHDIIDNIYGTAINNLGEIFPLTYSLNITKNGNYTAVNLFNPDTSLGYDLRSTTFADN